MQTLHCKLGDHEWSREAPGRGRPPVACPECRAKDDAEKAERRAEREAEQDAGGVWAKRADDLEEKIVLLKLDDSDTRVVRYVIGRLRRPVYTNPEDEIASRVVIYGAAQERIRRVEKQR